MEVWNRSAARTLVLLPRRLLPAPGAAFLKERPSRGGPQGVAHARRKPSLGEAPSRFGSRFMNDSGVCSFVARQTGGHVREPQEDVPADEGGMLATDRAA